MLRLILALICCLALGGAAGAAPLKVTATVPELGDLFKAVGGQEVAVSVLAPGVGDAHFIVAKPSFIKLLNQADIYAQLGLNLEDGWAPVLLKNARNSKIQQGSQGFVDASGAIQPKKSPQQAGVDGRTGGDVHPNGNPHYLLDPLNGIKVAELVKNRLSLLRPARKAYFAQNFARFKQQMSQGLQGWQKALAPYKGAKVVADHDLWLYFASRYGLAVVGLMEPKPGIAPTTQHLQHLVGVMKAHKVRVVLSVPYFSASYAQFLHKNTQARVVPMAHQVGARPGADTYFKMCDYNVRQLVNALKQ